MTTNTIGGRTGADYAGYDDTFIEENTATTVHYTDGYIYVGSWGSGNRRHGIINFSGVSSISGPVTVSSASIALIPIDAGSTADYSFYRLNASSNLAQATWNDKSTGVSWAGGGALNSTDADLTALATASISSANNFTDVTFTGAGLAAYFEGVINGTITNNSLLIARNPDAAYDGIGEIRIRGKNQSASFMPLLTLVYTAGSPGPTVTSVTQTSGGTEGSPAVMTVALSGATSGSTNFAATLAGVTATGSGTDFTSDLASATYSNGVTFSGGNMVVPDAVSGWTVTIATTSDTLDEANETATLTIGGTAGTLTITDDDAAPTISVNDVTESAGSCIFTVSLSAASGKSITVDYATADGTSTAGVDYTAASGTLTFAAGETTKTVTVTVP